MAQYRVTALYYKFRSENAQDLFDEAAPLSGTIGSFDFRLDQGILTATPNVEFRDRQAARDAIEPLLRDWEQSAFVTPYAYRIRFDYERSDVEEVDPQPGAVTVFPETIVVKAGLSANATIVRSNPKYPGLDTAFVRTPVTDRLTERLRRLRDREAELPAIAYVVLDTLEHEFGGTGSRRRNAAQALAVDEAVLDRLGALSSRADPDIGRKGGGDPTPLTPLEQRWIEEVIVRLIRRVGEHAAGATLAPISMSDFTALP